MEQGMAYPFLDACASRMYEAGMPGTLFSLHIIPSVSVHRHNRFCHLVPKEPLQGICSRMAHHGWLSYLQKVFAVFLEALLFFIFI